MLYYITNNLYIKYSQRRVRVQISKLIKLEYTLRSNIGNREYLPATLKTIKIIILDILTFKVKLNTDNLDTGNWRIGHVCHPYIDVTCSIVTLLFFNFSPAQCHGMILTLWIRIVVKPLNKYIKTGTILNKEQSLLIPTLLLSPGKKSLIYIHWEPTKLVQILCRVAVFSEHYFFFTAPKMLVLSIAAEQWCPCRFFFPHSISCNSVAQV